MEKENITILTRQRGSIKHKITSFRNYVNKLQERIENREVVEDKTYLELELRINKNENVLQEFENIQAQIETLIEDNLLEEHLQETEKFETSYFEIMAQAKHIVATRHKLHSETEQHSISEHSNHSSVSQRTYIKLPTIKIPTFDGSYDKWLEFKDTYRSLIHNNENLDNVHKYHYLRDALQGIAADVIRSLDLSSANYNLAWELMCNRFDNKRLLSHTHIKQLFSVPSIGRETSINLRQLVDGVSKHINALNILEYETQNWDPLIIYIITTKLDKTTLREWEQTQSENPTLQDMYDLLRKRANLLDTLEMRDKEITSNQATKKYIRHTTLLSSNITCSFCKEQHFIYACSKFLELSIKARVQKAIELKLCLNCLKPGHFSGKCQSVSCKKCSKKHNTILHYSNEENKQCKDQVALSTHTKYTPQILLSTATLLVRITNGKYYECRAILDSGSQSNFITKEFCDKFSLPTSQTNISIVGINKVTSKIQQKCTIEVKSRTTNYSTRLQCLVVPTITEEVPSAPVHVETWNIPHEVQLADPEFGVPSKIDLLIGAGLFWRLILIGQISLGRNKPLLQNTRLGWVVSGDTSLTDQTSKVFCNFNKTLNVQQQLQQFWEIEEMVTKPAQSKEEQSCELNFQETTTRQQDGRFIVSIPLKHPLDNLGDSRERALQRLFALERRFERDNNFQMLYKNFLQEYELLGHMSKIEETSENRPIYYLPHHGVLNTESSTTKLRVVFDGSAASSTGWSINDLQAVGPTIQQDLISIILRFRQHKFVLTADVEKMYRQVNIVPDQRNLQCILWRFNATDEVSTYSLNTVTYGTASAPFLAIRCLHQLSIDNLQRYPAAARIVKDDFYVDDLLTGGNTREQLEKIHNDVTSILQQGCMKLRKWRSNETTLPFLHQRDPLSTLALGEIENQVTKTLGIHWFPVTDTLFYKIKSIIPANNNFTKRMILADIARIFDPLGLLSPCILMAKIIIQRLWQLKLEWDEPVPPDLKQIWIEFRETLPQLNTIRIPRYILTEGHNCVQLHGFSDASKTAYGTCIYARSTTLDGRCTTNLICAKGKVSPLKPMTIPRLELTGAALLARLMKQVISALRDINIECYYWCDSQVTLAWLKTQPNLLQPYVSHRVAQIQQLTDINNWRYIASKENPADQLSRGTSPDLLPKSRLWWYGPEWLTLPADQWPSNINIKPVSKLPELKSSIRILVTFTKSQVISFEDYSNYKKLVKIMAYCLRFITNCKRKNSKVDLIHGPLLVIELDIALKRLVKLAQHETFHNEVNTLLKKGSLVKGHMLNKLSPFLDEDGIIRVGGRLKNSNFHVDKKHPYLLSAKHALARLILESVHKELLHAGPQLVLSATREQFWIPASRNLVRKVVHNCIICFRCKPRQQQPIMGNLPRHRVTASYPFYATGIDYAGPLTIKDRPGRGAKPIKCYICVFVCLTCKAMHLEPVTSLSTEAFLGTLKRFVARRGLPQHIYSDNGRNFVGASKELGTFLQENTKFIVTKCHERGITWHFIPPYSPHFGGIWEAGVKSTKHHLRRMLTNTLLHYEELLTVLTQIEGILNSRPLSVLSTDPTDPQPLTPGHFLIGRSPLSLPESDYTNTKQSRLSRFQYLQQLKQHFWQRWSREYISELQERTKWRDKSSNIYEGDVVILKEDNTAPCHWKIGVVSKLHPGEDEIVRVVSVKTSGGIVKRALTKICILPV